MYIYIYIHVLAYRTALPTGVMAKFPRRGDKILIELNPRPDCTKLQVALSLSLVANARDWEPHSSPSTCSGRMRKEEEMTTHFTDFGTHDKI